MQKTNLQDNAKFQRYMKRDIMLGLYPNLFKYIDRLLCIEAISIKYIMYIRNSVKVIIVRMINRMFNILEIYFTINFLGGQQKLFKKVESNEMSCEQYCNGALLKHRLFFQRGKLTFVSSIKLLLIVIFSLTYNCILLL